MNLTLVSKFHSHSLSLLAGVCLLPAVVTAAPVFQQKDPSQVGWRVDYQGSRYDAAADVTHFHYSLTVESWEKDLSHWVLGLNLAEAPAASGTGTCYGLDPTTGLSGLKWDCSQPRGSTADYSIAVRGRVGEATTSYAVKGGTYFAVASTTGPGALVPDAYAIDGVVFVDAQRTAVLEAGEPVLPAVQVTLSDALGQVLAVTRSDNQGRYRFEGLPAGTYRVQVPAAGLGDDFNAMLARYFTPVGLQPLVVTLTSADATAQHLGYAMVPLRVLADFDSADADGNGRVFAGEGRTIGFWKHQNTVALTGKGRAQVDAGALREYLQAVEGLCPPAPFLFTDGAEFREALGILGLTTQDARELLCKQLLATELNHVAGLGLAGEERALQEVVINWAEHLARNSAQFTRAELLTAKDICDLINNMGH